MNSMDNGQLQAILGTIYSSPMQPTGAQPARRPAKKTMPRLHSDPDMFSSDEFRMFCYKIVPCGIRGPHEWTTCGFCHPGEKAMRRCPQKYNYTAIACPELKMGQCTKGDSCIFAHSLFEYWLHPTRYRTQLCSYGTDCKRSICFFAHHCGELRDSEHLTQLLAIEREIDGGEAGFGFQSPGSRWPTSPAAAQTTNTRQARAAHATQQQGSPIYPRRGAVMQSANSLPSPAAPALQSPLHSLSSQDIDSQMAAAVKLLADLSVTKQQLQQQEQQQQQDLQRQQQQEMQQQQQQNNMPFGAFQGWQAAAAAALQQPNNSYLGGRGHSAVGGALQQQYSAPVCGSGAPQQNMGGLGNLPSGLASVDLQSAWLSLLPELMKQLGPGGGVNEVFTEVSAHSLLSSAALAAWGTPSKGEAILAPSEQQHRAEMGSPVNILSVPPSTMSSDVLSSHIGSDGCMSPVPSYHSEECGEDPVHLQTPALVASNALPPSASSLSFSTAASLGMDQVPAAFGIASSTLGHWTTAEMLSDVQELDMQLRKLSMSPSIELPHADSVNLVAGF